MSLDGDIVMIVRVLFSWYRYSTHSVQMINLDGFDLEVEPDKREDQTLQILDQVVETHAKKLIKTDTVLLKFFFKYSNMKVHENRLW